MDIVRTPSKKPLIMRYRLPIAIGAIVLVLLVFLMSVNRGSHIVDSDTLLYGTVERGDFTVLVRGPGVLVPKDIRWIAANVEGRVERILVKAGAQVNAGDLLLELSNPQLVQQFQEAQWELEALEANIKANEVSLESQLLDRKAVVNNARLEYETEKLRLNAQAQLFELGNAAISKLDFEASKLRVEQFKQRWEIEQQRFLKMKENLQAQRDANAANLNRMRKSLQRVQGQVESLQVKASMDSVVQEMPLELGQRVSLGINIAKLARHDELIAELRIPETQIQQVAQDQLVTVDLRTKKVIGRVTRVDPAVTSGSVQVDVAFDEPLPPEARPDLSVDGVIEVSNIKDTLFVNRPIFAQSFSETTIFKLNDETAYADRLSVEFGQGSTSHIQVISGLEVGDRIIVSDPSAWESHQRIRIN